MASSKQPLYCTDYHLLPARLMLDEEHAVPPYDTHYDDNTYIFGKIRGHTIVVATCSQGETGNCHVGIGGGIPRSSISKDSLNDIHLEDVDSLIEGQWAVQNSRHNAEPDWRLTNALSILTSDHDLGRTNKFAHAGLEHDRLFKAGYHHIGEYGANCAACDKNELVQRPPRTENDKSKLVFHRGRIATGNSVIQDGQLRDQIGAICGEALCIEMEAAGVDVNRKCLVIHGVFDYADTHKDDMWRSHAAGKATDLGLFLSQNPNSLSDERLSSINLPPISYQKGCCGKTALALEYVYRTKQQQPTRAIFWLPVISRESFEQAYQETGEFLHTPEIADEKADVKRLVKAKLSDEGFGYVLFDPLEEGDNADPLIDCLPHSCKGSIIFTSRTREAAIKLAESNVTALGELEQPDAKDMLRKRLIRKHQHQFEGGKIVDEFLGMLSFLALTIVQAVAFVNTNGMSLSEYNLLFRENERHATDLLNKQNPVATTRYISFEQIRKHNELAATHLSFMACTASNDIPASILLPSPSKVEHIEAIGMLKAYTLITERDTHRDGQQGQTQSSEKAFDVHPLVHLAMRGWLKANNQWSYWTERHYYDYGEMHRETLVLREKALGKEHLFTLTTINNLAQTLSGQGKYAEAEKMHRETLALREKVLGKEHPDTLNSLHQLASLLKKQKHL
ncbi:hypothetical protein GQ43DRAFT_451462 [Delitschia confertaspora ATCC 74209]|uniref:Tetratricopeptide repeat protein n=1 Tax=Delitschia confertaspora ATCC 74209 TaxID=1513339 RepID=A0A9P4JEP9_9PLEO|nr:hypothetical protein GQ43DRAFT_451462 [Delitschia confertaspora ATCC 74209]